MILLHIIEGEEKSVKLKNQLEELVISYRTECHSSGEIGLPFIEENGSLYKEEEEIKRWLDELKAELKQQRSLSGDGCYIDPKSGKTC